MIRSDGSFEDAVSPELAELRIQIREAHNNGATRELERLRSEYRSAAHGGQSTSAPTPRRTSPARQELDDPKREIIMRIASFNELGCWSDRDGKNASWGYFRDGAFDRWLAEHSPADLPFSIEHEPVGNLARWRDLWLSAEYLWGVAVVERGADEILEYADAVAGGCSVGAEIISATEHSETREDGAPVFDVHELRLLDAGPVERPADPESWIISVGGRVPWQHRIAEQHERHLKLGEAGILRTAGNGTWRPRFGA